MGSDASMRLIEAAPFFEISKDEPVFMHKAVIYTNGNELLHARIQANIKDAEIDLACLQGSPISMDDVYPLFNSTTMTLLDDPPEDCYVKTPSLLSYMLFDDEHVTHLKDILLTELNANEVFRRTPHPNLAEYYGCTVRSGRVTSLYFKRYQETLKEILEQGRANFNVQNLMISLRSAVGHIHKLGYCHNDLHPGNIMFDEHQNPVIIDFDTCMKKGEKLGIKAGNQGGFFPEEEEFSVPRNDFYSLQKIESYIKESLIAREGGSRDDLVRS